MLLRRELKRNLKSFLIASVICGAMSMYVIAMSDKMGVDIQQILDLKLPPGLQMAFGMTGLDFNSPMGFFGLMFSYIYLFISIYLAGLFATIVSKEFSEKTAEYLFSLPIRRLNIILIKLFVAFIYAVLTVCVITVVSLISFESFIKQDTAMQPVYLMALAWLIGSLYFGSLGFLLSSFVTRTRTITSASVGLVLVFYLLQVAVSMNKDLSFLKYISPFDWFKGSEIVNSGGLSFTYCMIAIGLSALCLSIGIIRFKKMDVLI